jgi:hypothetical protein
MAGANDKREQPSEALALPRPAVSETATEGRLERDTPFRIQIGRERFRVPARARSPVEHEHQVDEKETEFRLKWPLEIDAASAPTGDYAGFAAAIGCGRPHRPAGRALGRGNLRGLTTFDAVCVHIRVPWRRDVVPARLPPRGTGRAAMSIEWPRSDASSCRRSATSANVPATGLQSAAG